MKLIELRNKLERRLQWKESSEAEVDFGCTALLALVLLVVLMWWGMS